MRPDYPKFLEKIYAEWECNKVVFIGDVVSWDAISFHDKETALYNAHDEFKKARKQVAKLSALFPKAEMMIGNHDCLPARKAATVGVPEFALQSFNQLWDVKWKVHPRFSRIVIDGVIYAHGDVGKGGMYAAVKNSRDNFQSYVQGHTHSEAGVWWTVNQQNRVFGMNVGCGADHEALAMHYGKKFNKKPILGCGVVLDGKQAFFEPMIL
jgi:hypothetical protein